MYQGNSLVFRNGDGMALVDMLVTYMTYDLVCENTANCAFAEKAVCLLAWHYSPQSNILPHQSNSHFAQTHMRLE